jgi:hypothetical protein
MIDILTLIPGKRKLTGKGWYSFNAVCCHNRGHKADRRSRGGIKITSDTEWSYHCFNCNFKAHFHLGRKLSVNCKSLLKYLGYSPEDIQRVELESLRNRDLLDYIKPEVIRKKLEFPTKELPLGSIKLDINNDQHYDYLAFLINRGLDPSHYEYYITPNDTGRNSTRLIIPYYYKHQIVGYTSRYIEATKNSVLPKYVKDIPSGFLFGIDFQQPNWQNVLVVEGEFDAISIQACALLTNTISDEQSYQLNQLHRPVIVVPDQDKSGLKLVERAIDLGYKVSLPEWDTDVKDVNDAVKRYGVLATLQSIYQNATRNKIIIDHNRRRIEK